MQDFLTKQRYTLSECFLSLFMPSRAIITSTRDIEMACHENIKFRFLLQNFKIPDHSAISRFLIKTEDILLYLFEQFIEKIFEMEYISTETIYIDGTKIEAYANEYTFVWKKSIEKYRTKLNDDFNLQYDNFLEIYSCLSNLSFQIVKGRGKQKSKEQKYLELCTEYLEKYQKYSNHLKI